MLLELCAGQGLIITNSPLQQKARLKMTWQNQRSKHWHFLDYVLLRQKDQCCTPKLCPVPTAIQTTSWLRAKSDSTSSLLWGKEGYKSRSFTPTGYWRGKLSLEMSARIEEKRSLHEKLQRMVWREWCWNSKVFPGQVLLSYKASMQVGWPCYQDSIQERVQLCTTKA